MKGTLKTKLEPLTLQEYGLRIYLRTRNPYLVTQIAKLKDSFAYLRQDGTGCVRVTVFSLARNTYARCNSLDHILFCSVLPMSSSLDLQQSWRNGWKMQWPKNASIMFGKN